MLMQSLGHEIVHLDQYQRTYTMNVFYIDAAIAAFRELEASTWDTGTSTRKYSKKYSNFFDWPDAGRTKCRHRDAPLPGMGSKKGDHDYKKKR